MEKYWICLLLLSAAAVNAQHDDDSYPLEWGDYSDLYDDFEPSLFSQEEKKQEDENKEDAPLPSEDNHLKEEFEQIEDNRSAQNVDEVNDELVEKSEENKDKDTANSEEDKESVNSDKIPDEKEETQVTKTNQVVASQEKVQNEGDNVEIKSEEKKPNDDESSVYMDQDEEPVLPGMISFDALNLNEENDLSKEKNDEKDKNVKDVLEETKKILEETNDNFEEKDDNDETSNEENNDKYVEEAAKDIIDSSKGELIQGDTVDEIYKEVGEDLDKLMETWRKLNDGNSDYVEPEKNADDSINPDQISEYEDKYGVPYREKYVLSLREQMYDDANNDEKMSDEVDDDDDDDNDSEIGDKEIEQKPLKEDVGTVNTSTKDDEKVNDKDGDENTNDDDGLFKDDPDADDATSEEYDSDEDVAVDADAKNDDKLIETGDDAILDDNDSDDDEDDETDNEPVVAESMLRDDKNLISEVEKLSSPAVFLVETSPSSDDDFFTSTTEEATTMDVRNLNAQQYDQIMGEFVKAHADDFDISKFDVGRNVAPIHMTLTQEPLIVTSPNFPRPYPTNNIIDWMFTGEGVGIELIITDFFVNGVSGDYLLVKPGGIDASGQEGLVFSHMLNEPRRYRFLDVDKMFVRFEARPGMAFRPGFSFSVRLVSLLPDDSEPSENLPEPEALLPVPVETYTVLIGGPTLPQFNASLEDFRLLIADMATMYINSNDIDPGLNTTRQVTQISNVAVCNLNWPNSDRCSEVSFGVPLVYDDDDDEDQKPRLTEGELRAMWYLYSTQEPFSLRLRNLGMEEFTSPNDSGVLTVWLVIGFGLLISMAMLAFALWRFSCFENYARMPTYSDRDSVYSEKQGLDLYPTPHQTLPPLFSENEYKWDDAKFEDSTRVDLGGFTNKSYTRDELFDIDSDEDVIAPNKRDRGYQPRGFEV